MSAFNNDSNNVNIEVESVSSDKSIKHSDAKEGRQFWTNGLEFLMSCISVSVGLGNIWRFPFTAYENGGGAFLIPYILVLILIGKPMYYLEALLGQFTSKSSVKIWSMCPAFFGVGIGQAYAGVAVLTYYSSLLAITLYYLIVSLQSVLPWSYCRTEWGLNCVDSQPHNNSTLAGDKLQSSSELYFLKIVVREMDDISDGIGMPSWQLTLYLFIAWLVTFLVIIRGVKSAGKAAYFLAIFPYTLLIVLLIRAVTLDGALTGITFFLKPNWYSLINLRVWKEAVVQCFFSLAVGLGPIVMFSSYNKFDHNVHRDVLIVTSLDTVTSLIAGITIFGILGNLAYNLKMDNIDEVVRSGTALAFISYPDAIAQLQAVPQLFAVLFFFMLFVLGVGTLVAQANTFVSIMCDQYKFMRVWIVALITSVCGFLCGIVCVTPGGQWVLNLVDYYGATFVVFGLAIFQIIGVSWVYVVGWIMLAIGFIQLPLWIIWAVAQNWDGSFWCSIKKATYPTCDWGPSNDALKREWGIYKQMLQLQRNERMVNKKNITIWIKFRNIICGNT